MINKQQVIWVWGLTQTRKSKVPWTFQCLRGILCLLYLDIPLPCIQEIHVSSQKTSLWCYYSHKDETKHQLECTFCNLTPLSDSCQLSGPLISPGLWGALGDKGSLPGNPGKSRFGSAGAVCTYSSSTLDIGGKITPLALYWLFCYNT